MPVYGYYGPYTDSNCKWKNDKNWSEEGDEEDSKHKIWPTIHNSTKNFLH